MRKIVILLTLLVFSVLVSAQEEETFALTIMHTNDTHAHHLPDGDGNGGVALLAAVVKQIRAEVPNSLFLDAGDRFTGTLFHTVFQGQDQVQIMNLLGYDAMTLGNHEFDNGDQVLSDFLTGLNFPVVTANIDVSNEPLLADLVEPYTILEVDGEQIGVIGLVTADTANISSPGENVIFDADYTAVANAAAAELTEQGVNKIILLTHTGFGDDEGFIAGLENIDIFVGGHSHTLFSNSSVGAAGEYPVVIESVTGPVYYVQASEYTVYLGRLDVEFDAEGVVVSAAGDTILLSKYITPDEEAAALIAELDTSVAGLRDQQIGATTEVELIGDRVVCRVEECPLGNIIADSMRAHTGAQIAIMNGGGIRANIDAGDITAGDVLTVQPFTNLMATFDLKGSDVVAALENGVSAIVVGEGDVVARSGLDGRFPQVSGIRYSFDPTLEAGSRIVAVDVLNEDGTYSPIDLEATYSVVTNNFMRTGGDGYAVLAESAITPYDFGAVDWEVTRDYLVTISPITAETVAPQGRITMVNATVAPLE